MEKIEFKDLPDTTTPITANNLNLLQENIESWLIGNRTANVDLNNYKQTGVYYFTTGLTHSPSSYLYCLVFGDGIDHAMQIAVPIGGDNSLLYVRKLNNNNWSSWKEL
jgi:hypothetical protein